MYEDDLIHSNRDIDVHRYIKCSQDFPRKLHIRIPIFSSYKMNGMYLKKKPVLFDFELCILP